MAVIPIGFGQCNFKHVSASIVGEAECTLGFENGTGGSAQTAADALAVMWVARIMPLLSSGLQFTGTLVKLGPNTTGPSAISPASTSGGDAAAIVPGNVSVLIKKVVNAGGRKNRGRLFLPGLDEADVDSASGVASAKLTALGTGFTNLYNDMVAADLTPYVLHGDLTAPSLMTGFAPQLKVATQRRRLRR